MRTLQRTLVPLMREPQRCVWFREGPRGGDRVLSAHRCQEEARHCPVPSQSISVGVDPYLRNKAMVYDSEDKERLL